MMQYINRKASDVNEASKDEQAKKKVLIVGAGMIGITSAFVLSKSNLYDVTVIDKQYPIRGASEQNANTVTLESSDAFQGMIYGYIKDNLTFKRPRKWTIFAKNIFDGQFRFWLRGFLSNATKDKIKQSTMANLQISNVTYKLIDEVVNEVTNNTPNLVDFHKDFFLEIGYGNSAKIKALEEDVAFMRQYDSEYELFREDKLTKYSGVNYGLNWPIKVLNSAKFWSITKWFSNIFNFFYKSINHK